MNNSKTESVKQGRLIDISHFNPLILAFVVLVLTLVGYFLVTASRGANTTLYLNPASSTVASSTTFNVAVRLNTAENVSIVRAGLSYPATLIDFVGISSTGSAFSVDGGSGGGSGSIYVTRTNPSGVSVTGDQLVCILTFKSKSTAGLATVAFTNTSYVFRSGDNANILSGTTGGNYTITTSTTVQPPTQPPTPNPTSTPTPVPTSQPSKPTPTPLASPTAKPSPDPTVTVEPATTSPTTGVDPNIGSSGNAGIVNNVIPRAKVASTKGLSIPLSTWLVGGLGALAGLGGLAAVLEVMHDRRKHQQAYAEQLAKAHVPNNGLSAQLDAPMPLLTSSVDRTSGGLGSDSKDVTIEPVSASEAVTSSETPGVPPERHPVEPVASEHQTSSIESVPGQASPNPVKVILPVRDISPTVVAPDSQAVSAPDSHSSVPSDTPVEPEAWEI